MRHYYVTGYVGEGAKQMLSDLEDIEQITLLPNVIDIRIMRFLFYRVYSLTKGFRRGRFIKRLFYPWYSIFRLKMSKEDENCIVFLNSGFVGPYGSEMLRRLKKKYPCCTMVLYIVDPMVGFSSKDNLNVIRMMDIVYSVNQKDCKEYGFQYYPLVYSRLVLESDAGMEDKKDLISSGESDLYYLGSGTDRTELLHEVAAKCSEKGMHTDFHVLNRNANRKYGNEIIYHQEAVSYEQNIRWLISGKCILEIMHEGFDNPTQRYTEAVVYNKKLMTNNPNVVHFKYYNPEYVRIFRNVEEIDMDFVHKNSIIEYGYDGDFSPVLFIQTIERQIERKPENEVYEGNRG